MDKRNVKKRCSKITFLFNETGCINPFLPYYHLTSFGGAEKKINDAENR